MLNGFGRSSQFGAISARRPCGEFVARLFKADLWEVLAIIGVCQT